MTPFVSFHDQKHGRCGYAEDIANISQATITASVESADCQHLLIGKPRIRVALALGGSTLKLCVLHVLGLGALKQVRRITAWGPVTGMADIKSGPVACLNQDYKTMCGAFTRRTAPYVKGTVSTALRSLSPFPAITLWPVPRTLVNARPESPDVLIGKSRRVYSYVSHISLLVRSVWLGPLGCFRIRSGRLHFSTIGRIV